MAWALDGLGDCRIGRAIVGSIRTVKEWQQDAEAGGSY